MSFYRTQLEDFLKELDVSADTVLDIGGEQNNVQFRVRNWNVGRYAVLDLPKYDLDDGSSKSSFNEYYGMADVIFCLEVFEYLINPMAAIKTISKCLKPGGKAYISVPLVYPQHQELELDSLRYTERGFVRLTEAAGMTVANVTYRRARSSLLRSYYAEDGMKAAKGVDHNVTGYIFEVVK